VQLSSEGTADPDGDEISLFWDFDQDGVVDSTEPNPTVTFDRIGHFGPSLRVVDSTGRTATIAARVIVGNRPPIVSFVTPLPGEPAGIGRTLRYEVAVDDDQPVDCTRLTVTYLLGHDMHGHPLAEAVGCVGSFIVPEVDAAHAGVDGIVGALRAIYTDAPGRGFPELTQGALVIFPLFTPQPSTGDAGAADLGAAGPGAPDAGAADAGAP
jgi:PKD repeat protein